MHFQHVFPHSSVSHSLPKETDLYRYECSKDQAVLQHLKQDGKRTLLLHIAGRLKLVDHCDLFQPRPFYNTI